MQYLDALEGLRIQGYHNEKVTVRRYETMQRFIEGVRNFELKRNLALMYSPEQYLEAPPTVEALRFTVQQYLRMRGSSRSDNNSSLHNLTSNRTCLRRLPSQRKMYNNRRLNSQRLMDSNLREPASIAATHRTSWSTAC